MNPAHPPARRPRRGRPLSRSLLASAPSGAPFTTPARACGLQRPPSRECGFCPSRRPDPPSLRSVCHAGCLARTRRAGVSVTPGAWPAPGAPLCRELSLAPCCHRAQRMLCVPVVARGAPVAPACYGRRLSRRVLPRSGVDRLRLPTATHNMELCTVIPGAIDSQRPSVTPGAWPAPVAPDPPSRRVLGPHPSRQPSLRAGGSGLWSGQTPHTLAGGRAWPRTLWPPGSGAPPGAPHGKLRDSGRPRRGRRAGGCAIAVCRTVPTVAPLREHWSPPAPTQARSLADEPR